MVFAGELNLDQPRVSPTSPSFLSRVWANT
jgi:hypothetical protein